MVLVDDTWLIATITLLNCRVQRGSEVAEGEISGCVGLAWSRDQGYGGAVLQH